MKLAWVLLVVACVACKEKRKERQPEAVTHYEMPPVPAPQPPPPPPPPPPPRVITSPLPEQGPHPDYPTAAAAGTDKIFFLEEPDRGPKAPTTYTAPPRTSLTWTNAPFCADGALDVVCGRGPIGESSYRVGRAKGVTIVEEMFGKRVANTTVYLAKPDGSRDMQLRLDGSGNVVDARLFTQPGRYTGRNLDGGNALEGCGLLGYTEDKSNRLTELRCLQWLGDPMRDKSGVAVWKYTRDPAGLVTAEHRHGIDGAPIADTTGVHAEVYKRDATGRALVVQHFDVAGERVVNTSGCAGVRHTYGKNGLLEATTCLSKSDGPIPDGDGITTQHHTHNADGCVVRLRYLRDGGGDAPDHRKRIGFDYGRDKACNLVSETCIGETREMVACGPGEPAKEQHKLDEKGRIISTTYFAASGSPSVDGTYRVHERRRAYDAVGNQTEMTCWDANGAAANCGRSSWHGYRQTYDDAGRSLLQTYIDKTGAPANIAGIFQRQYRYDNYDHVYEIRELDANGKLFEAGSTPVQRSLWDATHRLFAWQLLDAKGNPASYGGCFHGITCAKKPWHALRLVRRPNGRVESNQFFDAEGQLIESVDCSAKPCLD